MFTFEAGTRVRTKGGKMGGGSIKQGIVGTVVAFYASGSVEYVGVVFDEKISGGHDLSGAGPNFPVFKHGYCRWGWEKELEIVGQGECPLPEYYQKWPGLVGSGQYSSDLKPVIE